MRLTKTVLFAVGALLVGLLFLLPASATDTGMPDLPEYSGFFGNLPEKLSENLPDGVDGSTPDADAEALTAWDFLLSAVGGIFADRFREVLPLFCRLLGLLLISAAINAVRSSLEPKTSRVLGLCSGCAVAAGFALLQLDTLRSVATWLSDLTLLVNGMTPVLATLYAIGGNVATASVSGTAMTVFSALCENLLAKSILPFAGCCLCLASVCAAAPGAGLDGLLNLIKKSYTGFLTFTMTLLCAILAGQHAIAAGSDSLSLRAARFVAGTTIPVVGGSVSESMRTLSTGIGMLRKCFGVVGIVLIALLTLPVIILLLLTRLALNAAAAFAGLLGCDGERRLLESIAGIYGAVTAVAVAASLMFVFMLAIFAAGVTALNAR